MIRPTQEKDIDIVLRLFINYINNSFFVRLDRRLLRLLLREAIHSRYGINFVYTDNFQIIGFISSTANCPALLRNIFFKKGSSLLLIVLRGMFKRPVILGGLWEYFLYAYRAMVDSIKAELLFIAIEPDYRSKGIATQLIQQTLMELKARGIQEAKVTTDQSNEAVNRLLQKLGFDFSRTFQLFGKRMNLYTSQI